MCNISSQTHPLPFPSPGAVGLGRCLRDLLLHNNEITILPRELAHVRGGVWRLCLCVWGGGGVWCLPTAGGAGTCALGLLFVAVMYYVEGGHVGGVSLLMLECMAIVVGVRARVFVFWGALTWAPAQLVQQLVS